MWLPSGLATKLTPLKRDVPREITVLRFSIWVCGCKRGGEEQGMLHVWRKARVQVL